MDFTLQNPNDLRPITIRKTLARLTCYVTMIQEGKSHEEILKFLQFSENDFNYLLEKAQKISNTSNTELQVALPGLSSAPIGSVEIHNIDDEIVAYF